MKQFRKVRNVEVSLPGGTTVVLSHVSLTVCKSVCCEVLQRCEAFLYDFVENACHILHFNQSTQGAVTSPHKKMTYYETLKCGPLDDVNTSPDPSHVQGFNCRLFIFQYRS